MFTRQVTVPPPADAAARPSTDWSDALAASGRATLRYGLLLLRVGGMKFHPYEAEAIRPYAETYPVLVSGGFRCGSASSRSWSSS